jgi:hypothetical protein
MNIPSMVLVGANPELWGFDGCLLKRSAHLFATRAAFYLKAMTDSCIVR